MGKGISIKVGGNVHYVLRYLKVDIDKPRISEELSTPLGMLEVYAKSNGHLEIKTEVAVLEGLQELPFAQLQEYVQNSWGNQGLESCLEIMAPDNAYYVNNEGQKEFQFLYCNGKISAGAGYEFQEAPPIKMPSSLLGLRSLLGRYFELTSELLNRTYRCGGVEPVDLNLEFGPKEVPRVIHGRSGLLPSSLSYLFGYGKQEHDLLTPEKYDLTFEDIGGQKKAVEIAKRLCNSVKHKGVYDEWGVEVMNGALLAGPPGNGKTLLAKIIASQCDLPFFSIIISDIATMWYGESERKLQRVFDFLKKQEGALLFMDELESLGRDRQCPHANRADVALVNTICANIDGIRSGSGNVTLIGACNYVEQVDRAIRRTGRFDRVIEIGYPDELGRIDIFQIHMRKRTERAKRDLFSDIAFSELSKNSESYSGSDIDEIVRRVLEEKAEQQIAGMDPGLVTTGHFLSEIEAFNEEIEIRRKGEGG